MKLLYHDGSDCGSGSGSGGVQLMRLPGGATNLIKLTYLFVPLGD